MTADSLLTELKPLKKKERFAVYLNHEFAFEIDISIVLKFGLKKGIKLSRQIVKEILAVESQKQIKNNAFRFLARRSHSEKELKIKLLQKGYDKDVIDIVLCELKRDKFIDDAAFAESFAEHRIKNKYYGRLRLAHELRGKGVEQHIIDEVVGKIYKIYQEEELARKIVLKNERRYQGLSEVKKKRCLSSLLQRKGFHLDIVFQVLP